MMMIIIAKKMCEMRHGYDSYLSDWSTKGKVKQSIIIQDFSFSLWGLIVVKKLPITREGQERDTEKDTMMIRWWYEYDNGNDYE